MRILITGSNGLLGQKLVDYCIKNNIEFLATSYGLNRNSQCKNEHYQSLDISNSDEVNDVLTSYNPTHIINTAALTNVDKCEEDIEECRAINVEGVNNLLKYLKNKNCHLQQISTDFIFDGKEGDYTEESKANPLSEYGNSKWLAEQRILSSGFKNFSIVRTSVVYGVGERLSKSNIVLWAINELKKEKTLTIVDDQFRAPTFAEDLAKGCMRIIELDKKGVYNLTGPNVLSMFEFVVKIAEYLKVSKNLVKPISTETLNQKAPRPKNSGLSLKKAIKELNYSPSDIKSTLFSMEVDI